MLNEEVRKIMTKDPVVVHPDDSVKDVSEMMARKRIQQIPVVNKANSKGSSLLTICGNYPLNTKIKKT